jgi:hypothetical protein
MLHISLEAVFHRSTGTRPTLEDASVPEQMNYEFQLVSDNESEANPLSC